MRKKKLKRDYECPECKVHEVQIEKFICTSVYPDAPHTTETDWEDGGEVDGGTIEF
nr:fatty-acid--CoA ligase [uncultured Prevotella sp.]